MSCSTSRIDRPSRLSWRRPVAGSSSNSSARSVHSVRAISIGRCGPSARLPGSAWIWSGRPCRCVPAGPRPRRTGCAPWRAEPQQRAQWAAPGAQVAAQRDVLQHRHLGAILTCWKVRDMPRSAICRDDSPATGGPRTRTAPHRTAGQRQHAPDQIEGGALAGAVGPDLVDGVAGADGKADIVGRHQAAELLTQRLHFQQQVTVLRLVACRQLVRSLPITHPLRRRQPLGDKAPQPVGRALEHRDQHQAKHDQLEVAAGADQLEPQHLQLVLDELDHTRTDEGAPDMADAAQHGHEQKLDALVDTEGRRVDRALEVRQQPAGNGRQHCRQHGGDDLAAKGRDAHRLGHRGAVFQSSDGAAGPAVQLVRHRQRSGQRKSPDQHIQALQQAHLKTWRSTSPTSRS